MADWLTGSAVREMNSQNYAPSSRGDTSLGRARRNFERLRADHDRLLGLLPQLIELAEARADEYGTVWDEIAEARACLKAQTK